MPLKCARKSKISAKSSEISPLSTPTHGPKIAPFMTAYEFGGDKYPFFLSHFYDEHGTRLCF